MAAFEILLSLQMFMLLLDLSFNTAAIILFQRNTILLTLYILQDTSLVLSIILLVITFSSTFVFQAGLITLLLFRFSHTIVISVAYLALSIALHIYSLKLRWGTAGEHAWDYAFGGAAFYYGIVKQTALNLSDPRLRADSKWLHNKVRSS